MKRIFNISLAAIALVALSVSCNKEINTPDENLNPANPQEQVNPAKIITISATLADTKVSFDPTFDANGKPTGMAHTWQDGDKLRVTDSGDTSNSKVYDLIDGAGTATAKFSGEALDGTPVSYNVEVVPAGDYDTDNTQTQASDGSTDHLKFVASASGVTDLDNITLTETSNIIGFVVKLPAGSAATVNEVEIETSTDDFATSTKLNVAITTPGDTDGDEILKVYANVPASWGIPAGTKMFLRFKTNDASHLVYTRYQEFATAATINAGEFNYIKMNCVHIDQYAGKDDAGTSANPYLIADKYQMDAMHQLMERGAKKYFKLIDDIDMTGIVWFPLNNGYPESGGTKFTGNVYDKELDFNGNEKTISNISTKSSPSESDEYASVFGVLMGNVYNLTIDHATIYPQRKCGILAGYVGTGSYGPDHCEVTNVTIKNSTLTGGGSYCGALAGQSAKNGNVFSNITITDCTVSTSGYAAGLIACISSTATVSDITVQGTNVSSTGSSNTATPVPDDGIAGGIVAVVKSAVDFDRCVFKNATITGPKNTNESPSTNSRYIGGLAGYVYNYASTFDDCTVNTLTLALDASGSNNNGRYMGGAFGYIGSSVVVGNSIGCSVTALAGNNNLRNYVGGFIGYNDGGTIKNCSASGSFTSRGGLGGFVAVSKGGSFTDDTADVTISGVGNLGGFVGITESTAPVFTRCSASGKITASGSYSGGFAGNVAVGKYDSCSASGDVSTSNTYSGGFVGYIIEGDITKCSASGSVTATANFAGGFAGGTGDNSDAVGGTVKIIKSMASGNAQGNSTVSGLVAYAIDGVLEISDSYSTGNILGNNRRRGGLVAWIENANVTITNCYASGTIVGSFEIGGLIGLLSTSNLNMSKSAAWNSSITANTRAASNWSSAACVGVTNLTSTLTDNYRNPNMDLLAYWGTNNSCSINLPTSFQHPNVSSSAPLTDPNGNAVTSGTMKPYQGKCEAGKTLSQLASTTLGWSGDVWDFNGDLPTLK